MLEAGVRHLPVMEDNELVGMISMRDPCSRSRPGPRPGLICGVALQECCAAFRSPTESLCLPCQNVGFWSENDGEMWTVPPWRPRPRPPKPWSRPRTELERLTGSAIARSRGPTEDDAVDLAGVMSASGMRRVVPPDRAVVVEDSLKGVGAARRVGFALVAWRMPTSYGRILAPRRLRVGRQRRTTLGRCNRGSPLDDAQAGRVLRHVGRRPPRERITAAPSRPDGSHQRAPPSARFEGRCVPQPQHAAGDGPRGWPAQPCSGT